MKLLITGVCGFVGSTLATALLGERDAGEGSLQIFGIDNFSRQGSEINRSTLLRRGVKVVHGDLRCPLDLDQIPPCDCVIDASANPSVLAGLDGGSASQRLLDHNLSSTIHLLEYCKAHKAAFILLSTSRVYSIPPLTKLPMLERDGAFALDELKPLPAGVSAAGISEDFSTAPPVSLYGATKLASEALALEYGYTFGFPVWINRCGVMAGAGQFGKADQGIISFWINSCLRGRPLKYLGFGGQGLQVRDALHPRDLVPLLRKQFVSIGPSRFPVVNLSGGVRNAISLRELTQWCEQRFGKKIAIGVDHANRTFDVPWLVLDSARAKSAWNWQPQTAVADILAEVAAHAELHGEWLSISGS